MFHDLTDLEPLLHQYDHEKVLVGPLLNLWTNSSFRVFNIAGKGGKIYETVGLGFFELEMGAQRRRADIVAALEGCFGEVKIFDNQLEMAQMAHTLWANDETARFLATVSWESNPRPTRETRRKHNSADPNKVRAASGADNESRDEGACMVVAPPVSMYSGGPTHAPRSAGDQAQPTRACDPTQISEPLYPRNLSDTDAFANPGTLAESDSSFETVKNLPAAVAGTSLSKKYRLWVLGGVAAYLALSFVVGFPIGTRIFTSFTSMRQTENEAFSRNAAASITVGNDPSQGTGTVTHPIPVSSIGTANTEAQLREAVRVTSPSLLTSGSGVKEGEADAAPFPGAQPPQNLGDQAEAAPDEQLSQSPKAQGNQADASNSLPQSSPPQTANTQSAAAETVPQPPEVAAIQIFVSPASTQLVAGHNGPQLLPSEAATPKAPEPLSPEPQRQASNAAIVPLPRPRPVVIAVSSDRLHRRTGPLGEGARSPARNPLLGLFGH